MAFTDNLPRIAAHLEKHVEQARNRYDKGDYWWELRACNYYYVFENPRLHSTKVSIHPTFSFSEHVAYAGNTSYVIPLTERKEGLFLLCILNSKVGAYYCRNVFAPKANGYYEVQPGELGRLPIRRIAFTTPAAERERLVDVARALYEHHGAPRVAPGDWRGWREHWRALWEWAGERLSVGAGEQSDALHDLLAHLAERMIALHKQKQEEARGFTAWLEGQTGSALDEWKLKTIVQSFWEQPWDELARALHQNRGRFAQTQGLKGKAADAALEPLARAARSRWERSRAALAPTLASIAATDRLIDLLVYRLYGLSDDEIELVE